MIRQSNHNNSFKINNSQKWKRKEKIMTEKGISKKRLPLVVQKETPYPANFRWIDGTIPEIYMSTKIMNIRVTKCRCVISLETITDNEYPNIRGKLQNYVCFACLNKNKNENKYKEESKKLLRIRIFYTHTATIYTVEALFIAIFWIKINWKLSR